MASQLRNDIAKAFELAADRISSFTAGEEDLVGTVLRWIDSPARFIGANSDIREAHRALMERVETFAEICETAGTVDRQSASTARSHALAALNDLQAAIFAHGRASEAADRVGIGKLGEPIRGHPEAARPDRGGFFFDDLPYPGRAMSRAMSRAPRRSSGGPAHRLVRATPLLRRARRAVELARTTAPLAGIAVRTAARSTWPGASGSVENALQGNRRGDWHRR